MSNVVPVRVAVDADGTATDLMRRVLGVEAYDEKKAGTVHIALGGNVDLGGWIEASIHCDLVIERPTVYVDGRLLLLNGENRLRTADWLLDVHDLHQGNQAIELAEWWQTVAAVHRSTARVEVHEGQLYHAWAIKSGRHGRLPVGTPRSALLVERLYALLPEDAALMGSAALTEAAAQAGIPPSLLPACVWLLLQYDLVHVKGV